MSAAECRRRDMEALLERKRYDAAVYFGGYVIECFLKYAITVRQNVGKLPADCEHHNLDNLAASAFPSLQWLTHLRANGGFSQLSDQWNPDLRYLPDRFSAAKAKEFCILVGLVHSQLKELLQ
ncbi:MAG: hypothetical protein V4726_19750 [Verrucomicrobiota bacterium]